MAEGDTLLNAVIGALVSAVVGFVLPFGPLFGGLVAGYLQGGDRSEGLRIGALSGVFGLVPSILVGTLVFGFFAVFLLGVDAGAFVVASLFTGVFLVAILALSVVYFVGIGALGGYLGNYLLHDTDVDF